MTPWAASLRAPPTGPSTNMMTMLMLVQLKKEVEGKNPQGADDDDKSQ